ncbi:hypothetical protein HJG60_009568 [Phyllostomus discolor]|uniref:Uncharacterized protein n=1 Tax=Phyllostomus discolor TaxID=89673 RepID=A0A834DAU9_9CHIR|nr:hypothetical protein HJG60_009568 [Phyllostomus discolor]
MQPLVWQTVSPQLPVSKRHQKQLSLPWQDQQYTFTDRHQGISTLQPIIQSNKTLLPSLPQDFTVDIMLFGPSQQEVVITLGCLMSHLHARRCEINLTKIWGTSRSADLLDGEWGKGVFLRSRLSPCIWPFLQPKEEVQHLVVLFGVLWLLKPITK